MKAKNKVTVQDLVGSGDRIGVFMLPFVAVGQNVLFGDGGVCDTH